MCARGSHDSSALYLWPDRNSHDDFAVRSELAEYRSVIDGRKLSASWFPSLALEYLKCFFTSMLRSSLASGEFLIGDNRLLAILFSCGKDTLLLVISQLNPQIINVAGFDEGRVQQRYFLANTVRYRPGLWLGWWLTQIRWEIYSPYSKLLIKYFCNHY